MVDILTTVDNDDVLSFKCHLVLDKIFRNGKVINNKSVLTHAYNNSSYKIINLIFKSDFDSDITFSSKRRTLLMLPLDKVELKMIKRVIDAGCNINAVDRNGQTSLFYLVDFYSNYDLIQYLIELGADVKVQDNNGNTILHHFLRREPQLDSLKSILALGFDLSLKNKEGYTPVDLVIKKKYDQQIIQLILDYIKDIDGDYSSLHLALNNKSAPETIELMLSKGADINKKDKDGYTPLHIALKNNYDLDLIGFLINNGADLNSKSNNGDTPLHLALGGDYDLAIVKSLISNGSDAYAKNSLGETALMLAAGAGKLEVVKYMHNLGLDITAKNSEEVFLNKTVLHYAVESRNLDVVKYVLKYKPELEAYTPSRGGGPGGTALHFAESLEMVKILLNAGMDINSQENESLLTPIYWHLDNPYMLNFFIDNGADLEITDYTGRTPLEHARDYGYKESVLVLTNYKPEPIYEYLSRPKLLRDVLETYTRMKFIESGNTGGISHKKYELTENSLGFETTWVLTFFAYDTVSESVSLSDEPVDDYILIGGYSEWKREDLSVSQQTIIKSLVKKLSSIYDISNYSVDSVDREFDPENIPDTFFMTYYLGLEKSLPMFWINYSADAFELSVYNKFAP